MLVLDGTVEPNDENEVRSPLDDYKVLMNELRMYKDGLLMDKPALIAVNKMDRDNAEFEEKYQALKDSQPHAPCIPISAKDGENLEVLLETVKEILGD